MNNNLLSQKPLFDAYVTQGPRTLSSYSFVPVFAWADFFDFEFKVMNEALCVFAHHAPGCFLYIPPLNSNLDLATAEECFAYMAKTSKAKGVARIENIPENLLKVFRQGQYNLFTKPAEYVYRKADLAAFKGNAYKSQRHDCNYFSAHYGNHAFVPYADEYLNECLSLYAHWAAKRALANTDAIYRSMLEDNCLVHERLMTHWQALGLIGRVLKVDGRIVGYTFGYPLDDQTFCVYIEVTDLSIKGAAAYLFNRFCSDEKLQPFSLINTMDDFAMPNVARAKQAYHPDQMIISYVALTGD